MPRIPNGESRIPIVRGTSTSSLAPIMALMPWLDTTPAAEAVLLRRWREMTAAEKATLVSDLSESVNNLALAGLRQRYPDASPRECFLRLAVLRLGRPLAIRAYPEIDRLLDTL